MRLRNIRLIAACVFAVTVLPVFANAQTTAVDSLLALLDHADSEVRVDLLNDLAVQYVNLDPDRGMQYTETAADEASELGYVTGEAEAYSTSGFILYRTGKYRDAEEKLLYALKLLNGDETSHVAGICYLRLANIYRNMDRKSDALSTYYKAIRILELSDDRLMIAYANNNLGLTYWQVSEYDSALVYYKRALSDFESVGNEYQIGYVNNNIGVNHYQVGAYEPALKHYLASLEIRESLDDKKGVALVLNNIGKTYGRLGKNDEAGRYFDDALILCNELGDNMTLGYTYYNIGELLESDERFGQALIQYEKSMSYYQEDDNLLGLLLCLNAIGKVSNRLGDYDRALDMSNRAFDLADRITNKEGKARALYNIADTYSRQGHRDRALDLFERALRVSREMNLRELTRDIYKHMSDLHADGGAYQEALEYLSLHMSLGDSLLNEALSRNISAMKVMYETEQRDRENMMLRQENKHRQAIIERDRGVLLLVCILLSSVLALSVVLYIQNCQKRDANRQLERVNRELIDQRGEIERLAITDDLTGLYNRRYFYTRMNEELNRAQRYKTSISCIMLDIDYFKHINDKYGHVTGDAVLAETSQVLKSVCRTSDIFARYGGEEFVVLLPETDSNAAMMAAEKLRSTIRNHIFITDTGEKFTISLSLGVVTMKPTDTLDRSGDDDIVKYADKALYNAKHSGRDRIGVADVMDKC